MNGKKKNNLVFKTGIAFSILVVAIMISSATAVPVLNKASDDQNIDLNTPFEENDVDLDEKKDSLFNLLTDILNNDELKQMLKNEYNVRSWKDYTYEDIENAYEEGLKKYESIDIDKLQKSINKVLTKGNDLYVRISETLKENDQIMQNIEKLTSYCEECKSEENDNDLFWYPGAYLICSWTAFVMLCFMVPCIVGMFFLTFTNQIVGWGLVAPFLATYFVFVAAGCMELFGIELPEYP